MINPHNLKRDVMSPEILSDPEGQFPPNYNRSTFMFRHGLSGHPLLQLSSLIDLGDRLERYNGCYWSNGQVDVTDRWDKGVDRSRSLRKTLEGIEGIVLGGKRAAMGMPSFQKILKAEQVLAIQAYIVSRARQSAEPAGGRNP